MNDANEPHEWKIWKDAVRNAVFLILLFAALKVAGQILGAASPEREVPYSELQQKLAAGQVERIVVSDLRVTAYLKTPDSQGA